jgi:hypothetical protein
MGERMVGGERNGFNTVGMISGDRGGHSTRSSGSFCSE